MTSRCRIYDAECLSPERCASADACCAGEMLSEGFVVGVPRCNEAAETLAETLLAIERSTLRPSCVIIIDNGDVPLASEAIPPAVMHVIRPGRNIGCAGAWNLIHHVAGATPAIIVNADLAVAPDTFEKMMARPAPAAVFAYAYGCFRIDREIRERVGEFDEAFYPVYLEDADYRHRLRLAGVEIDYWPTEPVATISEGREVAASGIAHGKSARDGYQGWTGEKLAWFHDCVAKNRARYLAKWGGEPNSETFTTPFNGAT